MTTSPQSPVPGRAYQEPVRPYVPAADRQPVRITGTVRTKPGIWRIACGVCLGLILFSLISAVVAVAVLLLAGVDLVDKIEMLNTLGTATTTHPRA